MSKPLDPVWQLRPHEVQQCRMFLDRHAVNRAGLEALFGVTRKAPMSHLFGDYTRYGATPEQSEAINALYRHGLSFRMVEVYLDHYYF